MRVKSLPEQIIERTSSLSDEQLVYTYRPEGWTIRQVVHHLADSHMNAYIRFKLAMTENQPTIKPYLEEKWAEMNDYSIPLEPSLNILIGVHQRLGTLLDSLSSEDFQRTYTHPEHGKVLNLIQTTAMYSWHSKHHCAHIENALKFKKSTRD